MERQLKTMSTGFTQFFDQLKRIFCKEKKEGVPREEDSFPSMEELFCEPKDEVKEKAGLLSKEEKRKSVRFGEPFRGTKLSIPKLVDFYLSQRHALDFFLFS